MAAADVDRSPAHRSCSSVETSEDNLEWLKEHALGFDSAGLELQSFQQGPWKAGDL